MALLVVLKVTTVGGRRVEDPTTGVKWVSNSPRRTCHALTRLVRLVAVNGRRLQRRCRRPSALETVTLSILVDVFCSLPSSRPGTVWGLQGLLSRTSIYKGLSSLRYLSRERGLPATIDYVALRKQTIYVGRSFFEEVRVRRC